SGTSQKLWTRCAWPGSLRFCRSATNFGIGWRRRRNFERSWGRSRARFRSGSRSSTSWNGCSRRPGGLSPCCQTSVPWRPLGRCMTCKPICVSPAWRSRRRTCREWISGPRSKEGPSRWQRRSLLVDQPLQPLADEESPHELRKPRPYLRLCLAGPPGFEPGLTDPESGGLPLPHGPVGGPFKMLHGPRVPELEAQLTRGESPRHGRLEIMGREVVREVANLDAERRAAMRKLIVSEFL